MTQLDNQVALVTGASRGLGKAFVDELLGRGVRKVYAAARTPEALDRIDPRVVPIRLDVTDPAGIAAAAAHVDDLTVLINNAGISTGTSLNSGDLELVRAEFETNFYGPLVVTRTLAPIIAGNGGGAILNVASVLSWIGLAGAYSAAKAALWSATNSLRLDLAPDHIQVVGLHVGYIDTDMTAAIDAPKLTTSQVVREALDVVEAGGFEVLVGELTRQVKAQAERRHRHALPTVARLHLSPRARRPGKIIHRARPTPHRGPPTAPGRDARDPGTTRHRSCTRPRYRTVGPRTRRSRSPPSARRSARRFRGR